MRIFRLQPSRIDWVLSVIGHGAGFLALTRTALPAIVVFGLSLLLLYNLQHHLALFGAARRKRIQRITIGAQHSVLHFEESSLTTALPQLIFYSECLLVLDFAEQSAVSGKISSKRSKRLLLWPDSLARDSDRRLRQYLRFDCALAPD